MKTTYGKNITGMGDYANPRSHLYPFFKKEGLNINSFAVFFDT